MSKSLKNDAIYTLNGMHQSGKINNADYNLLFDALTEIDTLAERDRELEELWAQLEDIPMDPDTECLEEPFMLWEAGVDRETVWHWFDERYSKGIVGLLYPGSDAREADKLYKLNQSCIECDSEYCVFAHKGICKYPMVYGEQPKLSDEWCSGYCLHF